MAVLLQNTLEQVRATLSEHGMDFLLLSPLPDTYAKIRFIGRFDGHEVVWNTRLYTLERDAQEPGAARGEIKLGQRGLMRIAPGTEHMFQLEVALNVSLIDEPTIKKTIMMMRNYRKLSLGLRTWSDAVSFELIGNDRVD